MSALMSKLLYRILNSLGVIRRYDSLKNKTVKTTSDTLDAFFKVGLSVLFCLVLVWVSVLMYVLFYYAYVPTIEHIKPVHLQFTACEPRSPDGPVPLSNKAVCGFPKAHVQLTRYSSLLMVGQPYKITVMIELPESESNKQLGMFMVCGQLNGKGGTSVAYSCRSTMLRYRSPLLHILRLFALGPLYVFDFIEEKQVLSIELFSNFEEDQNFPVTDMYIELKTDKVEVYSAKVHIDAHLSGLRYIMFHWPVISAVLGSIFNLGFIVFIMLLSWYQLYGPNSMTGKEFIVKQIKELGPVKKLASISKVEVLGPRVKGLVKRGPVQEEIKGDPTSEEVVTLGSSLESDDSPLDSGDTGDDESSENIETVQGKKCLILKDDEFEEETPHERKFILERKMSSSEA